VIGLPDPDSGERCCAVVVPRDSKKPPSLEEISLFLRERSLMIQKIPEQLEVIAELPRNATGKVLKFELRDRYSES
jgi:acyl-CoA synthetase (AMP-forming)/AMP-acid ligase II